MQEDRDLSFDALKGLAIIAVVMIHAMHLLGGVPQSLGFVCFYQLINFAVPAFFFVAGYWSSRKRIESLEGYRAFLAKRFSRILIPYLFWSLVLLGYLAVKTHYISGYKIIYALLTGGACFGYYFLIVLAQLYLITPVLQYINRRLNEYGLILVVIFYIVILLALYLSQLFDVIWRIPLVLPFYSWFVYYEIGLFAGTHNSDALATRKNRLFILSAVLISWVIAAIEAGIIFSKYNNLRFAVFPIKYSSFLYCVCVILGFLSAREYFQRLPRLLSTIGYYSFGIYFIHVMVLGQVVRFFQKFSVIYSFQALYQSILIVVTLAICLALIGAARKLLPEFFCSKILGF